MWKIRVRSSGGILEVGSAQYLATEVGAKVLRCAEVHLSSSDQGRQLEFDARQGNQPWRMAGFEFYK